MTMESFSKVINDPIHGHINLDALQFKFIDTPQFQRLRDLHQLGATYFVYLGASHKRFEHSIGVSYLAEKMLTHIKNDQPGLDIVQRDIDCVKLAGLCHDLGHGPFSHLYDGEFLHAARPGIRWSHEDGSEMMLDYLVDDNYIDIDTDDVKFIKQLIQGDANSQRREKGFLFDIVANKRNSIDVDKFDYIKRDCYNIGLESSYNYSRLIEFSRVIGNEVCFSHKEVYNVYELFHTRYSLFKRVYTHKVGKAIELMLVDAFLEADPVLHLSSAMDDPGRYCGLTDCILREIETSKEAQLAKSREIVKRIRKRHLYKFVDEFYFLPAAKEMYQREITIEALLECHGGQEQLAEHDVILSWGSTNYGLGDNNPVDFTKFYGKWNVDHSFSLDKNQVSYLVPVHFQEVVVRVFARDVSKVPIIQKAFRALMAQLNAGNQAPQARSFEESNPPSCQYSPNPGHTVPDQRIWSKLDAQRNWSPRKHTKEKQTHHDLASVTSKLRSFELEMAPFNEDQ